MKQSEDGRNEKKEAIRRRESEDGIKRRKESEEGRNQKKEGIEEGSDKKMEGIRRRGGSLKSSLSQF